MPSTSAKQAKFMRAVAHSPKFAKKVGVSQSVGKDFEMADKKMKKYPTGGMVAGSPMTPAEKAAAKKQDAELAKVKVSPRDAEAIKSAERSEGAQIKRRAAGGTFRSSANGIAKKGKTKASQPKMFAKGGSVDGIAMRGKTRCKGVK